MVGPTTDPMRILRNLANSPWHDVDVIRSALMTGKEFTYQEVVAIGRESVRVWNEKREARVMT